MYENYIKNL